MEINNNNNILINSKAPAVQQEKSDCNVTSPSFQGKADKIFEHAGNLMSKIEKGGFLLLFIIQDFLGMTVPRSYAGFLRDKDVTGVYNIQEGSEVLGREGLTGPIMMAVAPASLYIASNWGRSTSINSEFIKRYGNNLKEIVSDVNYDQSLIKNPAKFKQDFYTKNIIKILNETVGKENTTKESVEYILTQLKNAENIPEGTKLAKFRGKAKYRSQCIENIVAHINDIKYRTGYDLEMLEKVKFGSSLNEVRVFGAADTFDAMLKYSQDVVKASKKAEKLDGALAESIKHKALGKRAVVNVAMIAATLGVLSILPKIYAKSDVAPGARTKQIMHEKNSNANDVSFKGKNNVLENIGKKIDKNNNKFISTELEYNKHNFTNTLMAGLSLLGLLLPRGLRAYKRAEKDENGKRDFTEIWEILIRDVTSSLAVIFAVPMLTRASVSAYENKSGFVLMNKDRSIKGGKKFLDLLNPYSKSHVLTTSELSAIYDNINSKEKIINFCKFIDKNEGDLRKIISKSDFVNEVFNADTLKLDTLAGKDKKEANKQILSFFENIEKHAEKITKSSGSDKKTIDDIVTKLMKGAGAKGNKNRIASFAKGLNSAPGLLATFIISPYILGWVIPRLTYKNTRRIHEKQEKERAEQKLRVAV